MIRRILLASASAMALAGTALAADLPSRAPPPVYLPPPPTWTGFYAGLNAGGSWLGNNGVGTATTNVFDDPIIHFEGEGLGAAQSQTGVANVPAGGVIGGGQIGYNYQFSPAFLVGIEADIQGLGVHGHGHFVGFGQDTFPDDQVTSIVSSEKSVNWLGTVRGRLGWLATPTLLIYGDGGLAYGGVKASTAITSIWTNPVETFGEQWVPGFGSISKTQVGWTAGGGVEWMFMPNWSLKAEYLYYSLGNAHYALSTNSVDFSVPATRTTNASLIGTRFNGNIVRVGLNYHFNSGAPPVVARY
jgi:outer membrane immunogenic protein